MGGFAALDPQPTVNHKGGDDNTFPSVMTC